MLSISAVKFSSYTFINFLLTVFPKFLLSFQIIDTGLRVLVSYKGNKVELMSMKLQTNKKLVVNNLRGIELFE